MTTQTVITGHLNKRGLAEAVSADLGITRADAENAVAAVLDAIARAVVAGHEVRVTNFGRWRPVESPERAAWNPRTRERVTVPAKLMVRFSPADRFLELVRSGDATAATVIKRPRTCP